LAFLLFDGGWICSCSRNMLIGGNEPRETSFGIAGSDELGQGQASLNNRLLMS